MRKGYWIVRVDVADEEHYDTYIAANAEPLKKHGARFLVHGGRFEDPEAPSRTRTKLIEFPTYQAALDCSNASEHQLAINLRKDISAIDLTVIEGDEGPEAG